MLIFTLGTFTVFFFLPFWMLDIVKNNLFLLFIYLYMANVGGVCAVEFSKVYLKEFKKWLEKLRK